ncbi:hypothetical protein [Dactylosporangium matsuzakiense]|uniref:Uncharacterized protein n=1 Tax=Dactylosporangium matsuzakiense TaxID=53360 RepID=A0A9W6NIV5_9ACTN|nr:hypothetical protein [Dactylosporangium matsuzakiense]GLK99244.1 hypothetical protein GCM10017581_009850 [Dactylosporangium matsuzakiense]
MDSSLAAEATDVVKVYGNGDNAHCLAGQRVACARALAGRPQVVFAVVSALANLGA